ncbi:MAG: transglutaminaseTgpA domain-containing protein [Chloroflexaceae bacterium]
MTTGSLNQARLAPGSAHAPGTLLSGALLILLMTGSVVYALSVSGWAPGLEALRPMALLGLLCGGVFAGLRWLPRWLAHLLSAALALTWVVHVLTPLLDERLLTWRDRATDLVLRGLIWGRVLASGGRGEDIVLYVLALCLLCWGLAYGTAWAVLREGQVWRPIIMNATIALVNYTYVLPKPTTAFFIFLGAALLLLVYQNVRQRQALWEAWQMEYPDLLGLRMLLAATVVCAALIAVTGLLPGSVSVDRATRTWELLSGPVRAARERWEDMFSTISAPPGAGSGAFTSRGAALGGARQLSDEVVMTVRSIRYEYWRAVAFDRYDGAGWQNTTGEQARAALGAATPEQARTPRAPDEAIPLGDLQGRRAITQTVTLAKDRLDDLVVVAGAARSVSLPVLVEHNYHRDDAGGLRPNFDDTALIVARERLRSGATYSVTAMVSFADISSLRAAGDEYPRWVRERYLHLPDTVTARTRELAARLVGEAGAITAYDRAMVIQDYLRALRYNESIATPPAGRDLVDWFLFEQREGYCDYFASAMVVLLRSQGVPARWVRGYAGGEFDAERGVYVVRESVAHSWPEVYFPGFGWERFEPTPAAYTSPPQRPLTSAVGEDASDPAVSSPAPRDTRDSLDALDEGLEPARAPMVLREPEQARSSAPPGLPLIQAALLIAGLVAGALYWSWRRETRGLGPVAATYAGMALLAGWSGLPQRPSQTPDEYADTLGAALPAHRHTIRAIARAYATERYRRRPASLPPAAEIGELRRALIRRALTRGRWA